MAASLCFLWRRPILLWLIHHIPKWPPSGKNWDELHGNEVMRAKSEISTVSPETFRTKVETSHDKEEKTSQMPCMVPIYQSKKIFWQVFLPEENRQHRRIPNLSFSWLFRFRLEEYVTKSLDQNIVDPYPETKTLPFEYQFRKISGRLRCLDTVETENSIGRLGLFLQGQRWIDILASLGRVSVVITIHIGLFPQAKKNGSNLPWRWIFTRYLNKIWPLVLLLSCKLLS